MEAAQTQDNHTSWIWRLVVLGSSIAFGLVVAVALAAWGIYSYEHRSTPAIEWSQIEIRAVGIKASLKTELLNGEPLYQLRVWPSSADLAKAFDAAAKANAGDVSEFTIILLDAGGFELCRVTTATGPVMGSDGLISALISNGKLLGCSDDYKQVKSWNVGYNTGSFPNLRASALQVTGDKLSPSHKPPAGYREVPAPSMIAPLEEDDSLTGYGYGNHHLDTRAGRTFLVSSEGEQSTADIWKVNARLHFTCKENRQCLIENRDNGEAVHGQMLK